MRWHSALVIYIVLTTFCGPAIAQHDPPPADTSIIDVAKIPMAREILNQVQISFVDPQPDLEKQYASLRFQPHVTPGFVPNPLVTKKAITRFAVANSADTSISVWFFPGFYYWNVSIYEERNRQLTKLPSVAPSNPEYLSYKQITVAPHDTMTIVAALTFSKTYLNLVNPRLIHPSYLDTFIIELKNSRSQTNALTYIFSGLLLMMILYSLANFFQGANRDFLYYSGYAFSLGFMLLLKAIYGFRSTTISLFQEEYLDFILQDTGYLFYMVFMQRYIGTKANHPFLHKLYNSGIAILIVSLLSYTWFHYFTNNFIAENAIENITKALLLLMTAVFIVYSLRHWRDNLLRYLFWGNLCLFIFSLVSQWAILTNHIVKQFPGIFQSSLFYYELGLFLELVFFLAALSHKNRRQLIAQAREHERLKAENQMKEYEKELAVFKAQQQERERISADIHDELGSGMTAIRLMSEIARNKLKAETPAEIEKISQSADEVLNKMNAIIWSMNSGNDTMDNLVSYIRAYALEYFESTPVHCKVNTPQQIEPVEISGDKRRNIFLCIKETLNNALKHAKASEVRIDFCIEKDLKIKIADNGIGIDIHNLRRFGNGLKNIARRMESIGGHYEIKNEGGTTTVLTLPI